MAFAPSATTSILVTVNFLSTTTTRAVQASTPAAIAFAAYSAGRATGPWVNSEKVPKWF